MRIFVVDVHFSILKISLFLILFTRICITNKIQCSDEIQYINEIIKVRMPMWHQDMDNRWINIWKRQTADNIQNFDTNMCNMVAQFCYNVNRNNITEVNITNSFYLSPTSTAIMEPVNENFLPEHIELIEFNNRIFDTFIKCTAVRKCIVTITTPREQSGSSSRSANQAQYQSEKTGIVFFITTFDQSGIPLFVFESSDTTSQSKFILKYMVHVRHDVPS